MSYSEKRSGTDLGRPQSLIHLPFLEIHYLCNCIWVPDIQKGLYRLKYMNTACIVMYWHRELEKRFTDVTVAINGG